jgi:hypothetical protein
VSPLLLISLPTASYGWSFDEIVLLVPYLFVVTKLLEDGTEIKRGHRLLLAFSLVIIQTIMLMQRIFTDKMSNFFHSCMKLDYFSGLIPQLILAHEVFYFWVPIALGIVYIIVYSRNQALKRVS